MLENVLLAFRLKFWRFMMRRKLKKGLRELEDRNKSEARWYPRLDILLKMLDLIPSLLLKVSNKTLSEFYLCSGLHDSRRTLTWLTSVLYTLRRREPLEFDTVSSLYLKKEISMLQFLNTMSLDEFYTKLNNILKDLEKELDSIVDTRYKDRNSAILNQCWTDVFGIVETMALIALRGEES